MGGQNGSSETAARLQAILETLVDGVITINGKGIVDGYNPGAEKIFGFAANEVIGNNISMLMPEPDASRHDDYITNYTTSGTPQIIGIGREVMGRRKDGTLFPMGLAVSESITNGERLFTGIVRDISDRKAAEQALKEARDAAEAANRAKTQFLANMSHELSTPLNAIRGYCEMLLDDIEEPDAVADLNQINKASGHLAALVEDVLDAAKLEAGEIALDMNDTDLNILCREISGDGAGLVDGTGLSFESKIDPDLGNGVVDADQIRRCVMKLFDNAVKFTDQGSITFSAVRTGDTLLLIVSDMGSGMTAEEIAQAQQAFAVGDDSMTREMGGLGLGLTIAGGLVNAMGGKLTIKSRMGQGTNVSLNLPITG